MKRSCACSKRPSDLRNSNLRTQHTLAFSNSPLTHSNQKIERRTKDHETKEKTPVAMVDCVIGGLCVGTSGHDTITGSYQYDEIYALEGDDSIDTGNDLEQDYVSCGPDL